MCSPSRVLLPGVQFTLPGSEGIHSHFHLPAAFPLVHLALLCWKQTTPSRPARPPGSAPASDHNPTTPSKDGLIRDKKRAYLSWMSASLMTCSSGCSQHFCFWSQLFPVQALINSVINEDFVNDSLHLPESAHLFLSTKAARIIQETLNLSSPSSYFAIFCEQFKYGSFMKTKRTY